MYDLDDSYDYCAFHWCNEHGLELDTVTNVQKELLYDYFNEEFKCWLNVYRITIDFIDTMRNKHSMNLTMEGC